jgi:hypothetical protein
LLSKFLKQFIDTISTINAKDELFSLKVGENESAGLIMNRREKQIKNFIRGRAQRLKCSATEAPMQCLALLISPKLANAFASANCVLKI